METSDKQIAANRTNALKSTGPLTPTGKAIASRNALKHGLLAKEVVITEGEGVESQEQFDSLLADLREQFNPQGALEAMLVEKIAVSYWRLRRACRYEVGLIRNQLDNATDKFYSKTNYGGDKKNKTDEEIEQAIKQEQENLEFWEKGKEQLTAMQKEGKPLEEIYDCEGNWEDLYGKICHLLPEDEDEEKDWQPSELREFLNKEQGWSDDQIWQTHIALCDEKITASRQDILNLEKDKVNNKLRLQVVKMKGSIPSKDDLDRLLRYETAIERQFYKAMNQLERMQRLRAGDDVPAPAEVDLNLNTENIS